MHVLSHLSLHIKEMYYYINVYWSTKTGLLKISLRTKGPITLAFDAAANQLWEQTPRLRLWLALVSCCNSGDCTVQPAAALSLQALWQDVGQWCQRGQRHMCSHRCAGNYGGKNSDVLRGDRGQLQWFKKATKPGPEHASPSCHGMLSHLAASTASLRTFA